MRNLRRATSLALASIMLMGTMVVGTSATTFSDADDIANTEAVTILSALDVMRGRDTGDFDPTAVVTRGEMAAILCRVMYGADVSTSNAVGVAGFTDTVDHWAEGYIGMAASEGWIVGHGDGTFTPDETVTTAQAAVMMQRALGYYDSKDTSVDPANYVLDAIRLGNSINLFDGISVASTQGLSRDDVAAMTYNMMFNTMRVAYSNFTEIYYAIDVDNPSITNTKIEVEDDKTIAALVFDVVIEEDTDIMGRPVKNVVVDNDTLATTSVDYTAIFVDASELSDVSKKMEEAPVDSTNLLLNGTLVDLDEVFDGDDESYTGIVIEVYDDYNTDGEKTDDDTVYVAYTYGYGEVTKVSYDEDDDETTIRIDSKSYTIDGEVSFEKEDMVLFTAAGTELNTLTAALTVQGEVTGVATDFAKLDGEKYSYTYADSNLLSVSNLGDTYALYLTPYGYVIGAEEVEDNSTANADYLYIVKAETSYGSVSAKVVFADGTEQIIDISKIYEGDDYVDCTSINSGNSGQLIYDDAAPAASVFSYELSSGKYKLTAETGVDAADGAYITNSYATTVDADGKTVGGFLIFDDDTIFVDVENGVSYLGFESVPSYGAFASGNLFYVDNVVFMIDGELDDAEAGTYVYLESTDMYTTKIDGDTYYVYTEAYIDGELVKDGLFSEVKNLTVGNIYEVEMDSNNYVTDVVATIALTTDANSEVRSVGTSTIYTVGGNRYTYDSDSIFVLIDTIDEEVSVGSAKDLLAQSDDEDEMTKLMVLSDDDGLIEIAYIILSEK